VRILGVDLNLDAVALPCYRDLDDVRGSRPDRAESFLTLDRKLAPQRGAFVVRAGGDGLAVLGAAEGDYVLVEPTSIDQVEDGAVLVVRDGEGSVYRRLTRNGRGVYLHDLRTGTGSQLVEDPSQIELLGRVSALIHRMDGRAGVSFTAH
jgi:SOS-response transcriptional repressor LexA